MKEQYIKFIEGNEDSFNKAIETAELLGYEVSDKKSYGTGLVMCTDNGFAFTTGGSEEMLKSRGYVEVNIDRNKIDITYEARKMIQEKKLFIKNLFDRENLKPLSEVEKQDLHYARGAMYAIEELIERYGSDNYRTCEVLNEKDFYKLPDKQNTFKLNH